MTTPDEIRTKAEAKYFPFLLAWLNGEAFFPLRIPCKLANAGQPFDEINRWIKLVNSGARENRGFGYTVQFGRPVATRSHGMQTLPESITIDTQEDFLKYIQKEKEFKRFAADAALLRGTMPQLETWLLANPRKLLQHAGAWPELLTICRYFIANPRPGFYLRELPVEVHSKFVEHHQGILRELLDQLLDEAHVQKEASDFETRFGLRKSPRMVRFRTLDPALRSKLQLPSDDLVLPVEDFGQLAFTAPKVVICENLMPYLTIPPMPNALGIFGEGNAVAKLSAPWLHDAEILYWGDLDIQGFRCLASLRARYPHVKSMFMDMATLEKYRAFAVKGVSDGLSAPIGLAPHEMEAYIALKENDLRLEQERILHSDTCARLLSW